MYIAYIPVCRRLRQGFSLVELSIVLVILGLLVGGILAGQSLIRASELRAVTTEYGRYVTAMHSFRDKYFAIPGDFASATRFWSTAAACPGVRTTASAGVCDGDGNSTLTATATTSNEMFGAWEHLAMAGLIEGSHTGNTYDTATASDPDANIGFNIPASKMSNAGWSFHYFTNGSVAISSTTYFDGVYGIFWFFGGNQVTNVSQGLNLKPEEAWNIDTKNDDGRPATGMIRSFESGGGTCSDLAASNATSLAASVYKLDTTSNACALALRSGM